MKQYLYLPLPMVAPGQTVRVVRIAAGQSAARRLRDLGLIPGTELRVVQDGGHGPLILAVGDSRLAVERGIAHKVLVEPIRAGQEMTADAGETHEQQEVAAWHIA